MTNRDQIDDLLAKCTSLLLAALLLVGCEREVVCKPGEIMIAVNGEAPHCAIGHRMGADEVGTADADPFAKMRSSCTDYDKAVDDCTAKCTDNGSYSLTCVNGGEPRCKCMTWHTESNWDEDRK